MPFKPPGNCPICDEHVPRGLVSCPQCGSCARSGWNDEIHYDATDLPDDPADFDYDDFVKREFGSTGTGFKSGLSFWQWIGIILAGILILSILMSAGN